MVLPSLLAPCSPPSRWFSTLACVGFLSCSRYAGAGSCLEASRDDRTSSSKRQLTVRRDLLRDYSVEVTAKLQFSPGFFSSRLPRSTAVYVAAIPGTSVQDVFRLCKQLRDQDMRAVPHLAARSLHDLDELRCWLELARESEVDECLLIAGDNTRANGNFESCMDVLESGLIECSSISKINVAGHPEGSHKICDPFRHLKAKVDWATRHGKEMDIVTQICFDSNMILDFCRQVRSFGINNRIRIGMTGPVSLTKLMKYAAMCGVGPSMQLLSSNPAFAFNLAQNDMSPLLHEFVQKIDDGPNQLDGVHIHLYSFGGLQNAIEWINRIKIENV
mmetsp:Transcript_6507/g.23124  ORF Transcript_6507/g.23124 Transcript_6507/m.23124 type:complete len:332 (-) Transcript_6507:8-1003(-)